jgi:hypothetical protein
MDNVQKVKNCINIPLSQTFRSYLIMLNLANSIIINDRSMVLKWFLQCFDTHWTTFVINILIQKYVYDDLQSLKTNFDIHNKVKLRSNK